MWGVGLQARVKRSSGELPQQYVIQVMEIRSRLQQCAAAPFRYHSRPGRRAPAEIVPRDPAAPRVGSGYGGRALDGHPLPARPANPRAPPTGRGLRAPVIDLPVAEILKYIAADPRRESSGQARSRSLLDFGNDIAEYRRNIAGVELLHCRELLLQSDQLIAKTKIFCVPSAVFGTAGLLDLALMKRTQGRKWGNAVQPVGPINGSWWPVVGNLTPQFLYA